LFLLPAEAAHRLVMAAMAVLARLTPACAALRAWCAVRDARVRLRVWDREVPSPIGLAAGLDKDAEAFEGFGALGLGFVEVGTLTARAQPGNPKPRLFRLPADRALVNRMGFNNRGASDALARLARKRATVVGVNIGKSKLASEAEALDDYATSATAVAVHADYVVVNVSSPNTPGLRDLQATERLRPLLARVRQALDATSPARRVPLLVKVAPDLSDEDIDAVADLALELGLDGIVAVNTTVRRDGLVTPAARVSACGEGGLSGAPLADRALAVLRRLKARVGARCVLVSVGGIASVDDVWERLRAGATLVQIYTSLVYEGPGHSRRLARALSARLCAEGFNHVSELALRAGSEGPQD
jgi:dihydroorotate dehydrogenase